MAIETNIPREKFFIGAAHVFPIPVTDANGSPQDMTGWALEFVIRKRSVLGDGALILSKTTGDGIVIGDRAATGDLATVTVLSTDTTSIFPDTYQYALHRTDDPSDQPLANGTIIATAVARSTQ